MKCSVCGSVTENLPFPTHRTEGRTMVNGCPVTLGDAGAHLHSAGTLRLTQPIDPFTNGSVIRFCLGSQTFRGLLLRKKDDGMGGRTYTLWLEEEDVDLIAEVCGLPGSNAMVALKCSITTLLEQHLSTSLNT
jgi:hypothetical protein